MCYIKWEVNRKKKVNLKNNVIKYEDIGVYNNKS